MQLVINESVNFIFSIIAHVLVTSRFLFAVPNVTVKLL